ncbi:SDR family oxidoreductase [bacterium]|nr:SDR family oxidoreductase [bacterium]
MKNVVFITGCSSGFGYLTALKFVKNNWAVYGTVRNLKAPVVMELKTARITVLPMDVTDEKSIIGAVNKVIEMEKKIDVLVNNAGVGFIGPVEEFSTEEIRKQFEVNLFGVQRVIKEVLPHMRSRNSGKIINLSSLAAISTTALYGIYSATKTALEAMSEALNLEVSKWNITVSLIEPGSFATDFGKNMQSPRWLNGNSPYEQLTKNYNQLRSKLDARKQRVPWLRNPQRVANLIYKVAQKRHPKLRYSIGIGAKLISITARIFPYSWRLAILKWYYKW